MEWNDIIDQMHQTDIYLIFHLNTKEYAVFSAPHLASSKIDHMLEHKVTLNRFNQNEITPWIPWIKDGYQQKHKQEKTFELTETE